LGKVALILWSLIPRKFGQVEHIGSNPKTEITFVWLGSKIKASIKKPKIK